ncbi:MAG TPA: nucleotidyl transferase AbiEii/AbiGii toxin family protein [Polyangiaceae bacterium]|nr:nucleotidyl transferase AbiEii/AbiGii toxin family protein [Polyangiaceae bacterium]
MLDSPSEEEDRWSVDSLLEALANLWRESGAGDELRLIGGLAVRLHVGTNARRTADIDVVALTDSARARLLGHLEQAGWIIGTSGGWWRAVRSGSPRLFIDIAGHPVVSPKTFETISLRSPALRYTIGEIVVSVAGLEDIAALKLMAMRDQDLVDLVLLARLGLSAEAIADRAAADDVERSLSAGAHRARHALRTGLVAELYEQTLSRAPEEQELLKLEHFLSALERSGL